jgi:hypothetical protein
MSQFYLTLMQYWTQATYEVKRGLFWLMVLRIQVQDQRLPPFGSRVWQV